MTAICCTVAYVAGAAVTAVLYTRRLQLSHLRWEDVVAIALWPVMLTVLLTTDSDQEKHHG